MGELQDSELQDLQPGCRLAIGSHHFSVENVISFAQRFDPQPAYLDVAAAGRLRASDWHVVVAWMPLMVAHRATLSAQARARGEPDLVFGPSPGVAGLRWLKPVHAGDTVTYTSVVTVLRRSASRPGWSLFTLQTLGVNQHGESVASFKNTVFVSQGATP